MTINTKTIDTPNTCIGFEAESVGYCSERPLPMADVPSVWRVPLFGNAWGVVADLDAFGIPWELFDDGTQDYRSLLTGHCVSQSLPSAILPMRDAVLPATAPHCETFLRAS